MEGEMRDPWALQALVESLPRTACQRASNKEGLAPGPKRILKDVLYYAESSKCILLRVKYNEYPSHDLGQRIFAMATNTCHRFDRKDTLN